MPLELAPERERLEEQSSQLDESFAGFPTKSQFRLRKCELMRVSANRFTYSRQYIIAYFGLTIFSIITVAISLSAPDGCPHFSFFILEIIVLIALVSEVIIRLVALGKHYWKSYWNIADAFLMLICIVTFFLVFAGCSTAVRRERQSSTILLVIRNVVQLVRLLDLLWRNRSNISNRKIDIDLDDVDELGFGLLPGDEDAHHVLSDVDRYEISDEEEEGEDEDELPGSGRHRE